MLNNWFIPNSLGNYLLRPSHHRCRTSFISLAEAGACLLLTIIFTLPLCLHCTAAFAIKKTEPNIKNPLVDAEQNGKSSIRIVKLKQDGKNGIREASGAEEEISGQPLAGVEFTLKKIGSIGQIDLSKLDLTHNSSWPQLAKAINPSTGVPNGSVGFDSTFQVKTLTTGKDGVAHFINLPFGFYQITETKTPTGATPITPIYLTLPFINRQDSGASDWNYHPVLKPKNSISGAHKQVIDLPARGLGDIFTYQIKTTTGKYLGKTPTRYIITDHLAKGLKMESIKLQFEKLSAPLNNGTDFQVTKQEKEQRELILVTFLAPGLEKIGKAFTQDPSDQVLTELKTKLVSTVGINTSQLENQAGLIPNQNPNWQIDGKKLTSPPVVSKLGKLVVTKVASEDPQKKLSGAVFQIYRSQAEAKAQKNPIRFLDEQGREVEQATTNTQGQAILAGLRLSNWANGGPLKTATTYWLVEKVAPTERTLLATPIEVNLDSGVKTITVPNPKRNLGFSLPQTGASGGAFLISIGLLTVGTGILVLRRYQQTLQKAA